MRTANRLYLKQIEVGPMENFMYIIGDQLEKKAVVVDPAWEVDRVLDMARRDGMCVEHALITHTHFDHMNGVEDFLKATDGKVCVHKSEAPFLRGIKDHIQAVTDGEELRVGTFTIRFLHTPGHTPGSQCFLISDHLVSGDTLFINACGRCDLPGGNAEDLYRSLTQTLMRLDERVILLPGHNYAADTSSTMAAEKQNNPYLRCENLSAFLHLRMGI